MLTFRRFCWKEEEGTRDQLQFDREERKDAFVSTHCKFKWQTSPPQTLGLVSPI